jgi:hypothetical protein
VVTLPLERVQVIVEHLLTDGSREGLILGDELNTAMGASARRRDPTAHHHEAWQVRESAKGGTYCAACGATVLPPPLPLPEGFPQPSPNNADTVDYSYDVSLRTQDGVLVVSCDYCNVRVGTFTEAERTIAERIATEHGGYHR